MKETKPYWYHKTAYSMEPYFVCIDFPNLSLHQIINYVKDKIGVVFLRSCVIFDTL